MANRLEIHIGGNTGLGGATEYTGQILRASYKKDFCGEATFEAILDIDKSNAGTARSDASIDNNVFFILDDGSKNWLLMKGIIENVRYISRYKIRIDGVQSKRASSGSSFRLDKTKVPEWSDEGDLSMEYLMNGTTWFEDAKSQFDDGSDGTDGEGNLDKRLRDR